MYTRAGEHTKKAEKGDVNSFIQKPQAEFHNSEPANFSSKVIKSFKDPLSRQITEAILIKNYRGGPLLNSKSIFYTPCQTSREKCGIFDEISCLMNESE